MPFTIVDNDEAFHVDQSRWMQTYINALSAALAGTGVISGCAVTQNTGMQLSVASGVVRVAGKRVVVNSANPTLGAANANNPRFDLIVVNDTGTVSVTAGTAAVAPKAPDIPANSVLLATVYVPALNTTIANNQITDMRCMVYEMADVIQIIIDGGGAAITTGVKADVEVPFNCHVVGWTMLADQTGSIVIDVWRDSYANFPPTVADTIAGTEKPTISNSNKGQDLTLTTWTATLSKGEILRFNVDSAATVQRVTLSLHVVRTT